MEKLKVISFYGGAGVCKSVLALDTASALKKAGYNAELVSEYAKDKHYDEHHAIFKNQFYIFTKQYQRLKRLDGVCEYAVTDSPLLLQLAYYQDDHSDEVNRSFRAMAAGLHDEFDNLSIYLPRVFPYQQVGRYQDEDGAKKKDEEVMDILVRHYDDNGPIDIIPYADEQERLASALEKIRLKWAK